MRNLIAAAAVIALTTASASAQPDWPDLGECDMAVADRNADGILDTGDIYDFIDAFIAQDESADIDGDGVVTFSDIYAYIYAIVPCFG
ncbi:MAG: hypothetical protein ACI89L_001898 [Phycisphaerales bacterium]|jgi:hypothetical protein